MSAVRQLRTDPVLHQSDDIVEGQHIGAHRGEIVAAGRPHPPGVRSGGLRGGRRQDRTAAPLRRSHHQSGLGSTAPQSQPAVA